MDNAKENTDGDKSKNKHNTLITPSPSPASVFQHPFVGHLHRRYILPYHAHGNTTANSQPHKPPATFHLAFLRGFRTREASV